MSISSMYIVQLLRIFEICTKKKCAHVKCSGHYRFWFFFFSHQIIVKLSARIFRMQITLMIEIINTSDCDQIEMDCIQFA